ncbi:MAG: sigma-54-dependent Fis family transcriptional regulator [Lentisphaerae bacterium]|nr:sigma-54-dependent Fis family transcriptional regulator [Lentisphaerota bacterium]
MKHLLIVDDERGSRESLRAIFGKDYRLSLAESADEAVQRLSEERVDLVLLDVLMPRKDGLALLKDIQDLYPDVPVIMVSASTSVRPVVEAIRVGAYDYVTKPFDVDEIRRTVERALQSSVLQRRVEVLEQQISEEYPIDGVVGESAAFRKALADARKAAEADATVLIMGESGTGKELTARCVHAWSKRKSEPFVAVHCAALPESLIESELFGHERGAFTSADRQKQGRFDLAGSGTLFFDEVSEMPLSTQVKLLRVLQEREFMRVGGTRIIRTEARIVAATAKDLRDEVKQQRFRDDLYYRLNVVPVRLPPLRERRDDIPLLAAYFLKLYGQRMALQERTLEPETLQAMAAYNWPGNVRELRNVIERVLVLHPESRVIPPDYLPEEFGAGPAGAPPGDGNVTLAEAVNSYEKRIIEKALAECDGIQTAAAARLGTTRRILKYRMEKLQIGADHSN